MERGADLYQRSTTAARSSALWTLRTLLSALPSAHRQIDTMTTMMTMEKNKRDEKEHNDGGHR